MPTPASRLRLEPLEAREVPALGLDPTFALGGVALDPLGSAVKFQNVAGVAASPSGAVVAAGNLVGAGEYGTNGDVAVARLTATGAADTSFSGDGLATFSFTYPHTVTALATQPDGKVVVAGVRPTALGESAQTDIFVLRLNADGTRDTTFDGNGEAVIDLGGNEQVRRVAVQADGKLVLAGTTIIGVDFEPTSPSRLALVRLTAAGARDATFAESNATAGPVFGGSWNTGGLAIQADGKIVVGGHVSPNFALTSPSQNTELQVLRFNPSGTPDTSFGTNGRAATSYGAFNFAYSNAVAVLRDGRIVVGGGSSYGQGLLAWFNADGSRIRQEQFGGDGQSLRWVTDLAPAPGGGVLAVGYAAATLGGFAVERHAGPGAEPDDFQINPGGGFSAPSGVVATPDGKFVVAGLVGLSSQPGTPGGTLAVTRFSDSGTTASGVTFVSSLTAPIQAAGSVTLTVQVVPLIGVVEEGVVTFREGSHVLGSVTIQTANPLPPAGTRLGSASLLTPLSPRSHTITAEYAGTARWAASATSFVVNVTQANAAVSLTASDLNPAVGEPIVFTANVSTADGSRPYGSVVLYEGATGFASGALDEGGVVRFSIDSLRPGSHLIRAVFDGADSPTMSIDVSRAYTATALAVSTRKPVVGQPITLTATVAAPTSQAVVPGGRVTFYDGRTILGTAPVENGKAVFTTALQIGARTLRAVYTGDAQTFGSDSAPQSVAVQKATTATTLTAPAGVGAGMPITLTATVRVTTGAAFPVGTVEFREGTRVLGATTVDGRGGARLVLASLPAGAHAITAVYLGGSTVAGSSSAAMTVTVGSAPPTTVTTATTFVTPPPAVFGQAQRLIAQVSSSRGAPAGRADYFDGANLVGSAPVDTGGNAVLEVRQNVGVRRWRAVFVPAAGFLPSASAVQTQTVGKAPAAMVVTVSGDEVRLALRPSFTGSPLGAVTLRGAAGAVVGTAVLNGNSVAVFDVGTLLPPGRYRLTAAYEGSSVFFGTASDPFDVLVV